MHRTFRTVTVSVMLLIYFYVPEFFWFRTFFYRLNLLVQNTVVASAALLLFVSKFRLLFTQKTTGTYFPCLFMLIMMSEGKNCIGIVDPGHVRSGSFCRVRIFFTYPDPSSFFMFPFKNSLFGINNIGSYRYRIYKTRTGYFYFFVIVISLAVAGVALKT